MAVSLEDQIACVRREIGMREGVYKRWVASGKMKPDKAIAELGAMQAVLATLEEVRKAGHYIVEMLDGQVGYGDNPVGFLVASHAALRRERNR